MNKEHDEPMADFSALEKRVLEWANHGTTTGRGASIQPLRAPPDTVFVMECEQALTRQQRIKLQDMWARGGNPLREHKLFVLDGGVKLRAYAPMQGEEGNG